MNVPLSIIVANFGHSHVPNIVLNKLRQSILHTVRTVHGYSETNTQHKANNRNKQSTFILFCRRNTNRSNAPYQPPKPFVLYSLTRCTVSILRVIFSTQIDRHSETNSFFFRRQQYKSSSPQVLKPFRPYSLQDQDPRFELRA